MDIEQPPSSSESSPAAILEESSWTTVEAGVWRQLCQGAATLNVDPDLLPSHLAFRSERRELRSSFLQTILSQDRYSSLLSRHGLRISGAWIRGRLNLSDLRLAHRLSLQRCRFEGAVDLSEMRVERAVSLKGSFFAESVNLSDTRIDGELSFWSSEFKSSLVAQNMRIAADLVLIAARCSDVDISKSSVNGQVQTTGACFRSHFDMQGIKVGSDVFLRRFDGRSIDLSGAELAGQVDAANARIRKVFDMQGAKIAGDLFARRSKVQAIDLTDVVIGGQLDIAGIRCVSLCLQSVSVASDFVADEEARIWNASLVGAKIGRDASLANARIRGLSTLNDLEVSLGLNMSSVSASKDVQLNRLVCGDLNLVGGRFGQSILLNRARVHGDINMARLYCAKSVELKWASVSGLVMVQGALIDGALDMEAIEVGMNVFLRDMRSGGETGAGPSGEVRGDFGRVSLVDAKVRGTVYARKSEFRGVFDLTSLTAGYVWLRQSTFHDKVDFRSGVISGDVDLSGSWFNDVVDCSGTNIRGVLDLGSPNIGGPTWSAKSELLLSDASVSAVRDRRPDGQDSKLDAWPSRLVLNGFVYGRLGGHENSSSREVQLSKRPAKWYEGWLARDTVFSNDPYQHLAAVLTKQGETGKANAVRYAARERHRNDTHGVQWVGLTLLKSTIGYGIGFRYLRSLIWVAGFSLLGCLIFLDCCTG